MPQMAPLNWLSLYIIFIFLFSLFLTQNYFHKIKPLKSINKFIEKKKINWKW
uniref:ATP synthase complex subunit 8 n=1 Tax=Colasposoma dauricum TaxID=1301243 RepID=A0A8A5L2B5_9CUCU|nr:ATP synthase F0 subunit 8 [Colasposoma dauricum]